MLLDVLVSLADSEPLLCWGAIVGSFPIQCKVGALGRNLGHFSIHVRNVSNSQSTLFSEEVRYT